MSPSPAIPESLKIRMVPKLKPIICPLKQPVNLEAWEMEKILGASEVIHESS